MPFAIGTEERRSMAHVHEAGVGRDGGEMNVCAIFCMHKFVQIGESMRNVVKSFGCCH